MVLSHVGAALLACAALAGCSAGTASGGFVDPKLGQAFIPLSTREFFIFGRWAAAVELAPGIAVTNDHNLGLIPPQRVLARSHDYDLVFFRSEGHEPAITAAPVLGETVVAYGEGASSDLREARGTIASLEEYVASRCSNCVQQRTMVFDADGGGGFSGGPVVDAESGAVLGITFGYLDGRAANGGRRMYAYDIRLVMAEMHRLLDPQR
jgi:hypothetical protein